MTSPFLSKKNIYIYIYSFYFLSLTAQGIYVTMSEVEIAGSNQSSHKLYVIINTKTIKQLQMLIKRNISIGQTKSFVSVRHFNLMKRKA